MPALAAALAEIVRRHAALRTTFGTITGVPFQRVAPSAPCPLPAVDVAALPAAARAAEAGRLVRGEVGRPFDLEAGPVLRTLLLRLGAEEHALLATAHHIASDGRSVAIFARELSALYAACREGRPSPLPEPPIQYADFAAWQRRWLAGALLERQLAWWRERLAGLPPALELPADRLRPAVRGTRGGQAVVRLPAELSRDLAGLGRQSGASLFMTLLAAFQALLGRWTGRDDPPVGTPVAGRNRSEVEELIGLFVNTLVLRADLAGDPSFAALLGRVRETAIDAYARQDVPFEKLVAALAPERDLASTPLFQVMFILQNAGSAVPELPGLAASRLPLYEGGAGGEVPAKFDLTLAMEEGADGLVAEASWWADLFDRTTVERLLGHFRTLLEGAVADPSRRLSELPLLTAMEREQLLVEWTATVASFPQGLCLHEVVKDQVGRTPDAVALVAGGERLTYRELGERVEGLAAHLRGLGVGPEVLVAVCTERDASMVVGMLATLAAGGAYVPLDPTYPAERLAFTLADAEAKVLLTRTELLERLPEHGAHVVCLDEWDVMAPALAVPAARVDPANLAYVIYTSGSTGRPKGVAITHASVVTFVHWVRTAFAPEELRGVFAATSITFDLSVFELFATLSSGGTVILGENALALAGHPAAAEVTLVNTVPSAVAELVRLGAVPPSVRTVNLAGEPLRRSLVDRIYELGTVERVLDLYGPSEDTTYSTWAPAERGSPAEPTIGRPIANTRAYVVDRAFNPQPVGVPGELWLTGEGLARGYLKRPELTAERFVPDPFGVLNGSSGEPERGARAYRTGDLARWRPSGELEFLGRLDHQVKVRGFRIELGEVESALTALPGVREAVVVVREDVAGERRLVAYVVPADGAELAAADLRAALDRRLPEHMVPAAFVALPALPLTPNGKVDRKALPAPTAPAGTGEEPRTWIERLVAGIWAEVLEIDAGGIGRDDSFFELGGHSLAATRVASRVRDLLEVEVTLRRLLETPALAALAAWIEEERRAGRGQAGRAALTAGPAAGELPASWAQERLWFLDQLEPGSSTYNVPAAFHVTGRLEPAALAGAFSEIVRRHQTLRTTFALSGGRVVQVVAPPASRPLPVVDLSGLPAAARPGLAERLARRDGRRPFDLARGPLLRTMLVRLGAEEHLLVATMHHIASDGWSLRVLFRELSALYAAALARRSSPLPELPVQYADFAAWQSRWLRGPVLAAQIAAWRQRLAGAPTVLELPADRPRSVPGGHRGQRGGRASRELPAAVAAGLAALARGAGASTFMAALAAFQALLGRLTGQETVLVGTPVAGRTRSEVEGLIGFFVNVLVLRGDMDGDPSFRELLRRVRDAALEAFANQDLPFEKLVEELKPERGLDHTPLFQVLFSLASVDGTALHLSGLEAVELPAESGTAKFDLTLALTETAGGLRATATYSADLFERATVERLLAAYETLLAGIVEDPEQRLSELPVLPAAERERLLVEWNDTATSFVPEGAPLTLHGLFEAQAAAAPDAVALVVDRPAGAVEQVSYGELDRRADRLARFLRCLGVGPEARVAVAVERSAELMVALLGTLKAGGAYVPLDPDYPEARLRLMVEDARPAVLLTQRRLAGRVPAGEARVVLLDDLRDLRDPDGDWPPIANVANVAREAAVAPLPWPDERHIAYVIYTSGSTGRPKGVMGPHRAIANYLLALQAMYGFDRSDRWIQKTAVSFDAAVRDLFWPLAAGASLLLPPPGAHRDPVYLARAIAEHQVTVANFIPSLLAAFVEQPELARAASLRLLVSGGEALSAELMARFFERAPATAALSNHYGPTEAGVNIAAWRCRPSGDDRDHGGHRDHRVVPVGRPLANVRAYVLDRRWQPMPVGVPGELVAGGAGIARGYLERPEATAEKFIPDPFGVFDGSSGEPQPGARLYRTGDLARWSPDGELEFLGRIDHQVKIRGFRIELGEIEAVLAGHPAVREAVADVREAAGDRRLVAWVTLRPGLADPAELRAGLRTFLAERLPDYMVPATYVVLDELPHTPNGKVDRRGLPAPEAAPGTERRGEAPRTWAEEMLAGVWTEVLGLDPVHGVGVHDDFFDLGGHSLLATRVASRVRDLLEVELPLRRIFETPTVAGLAAWIEEAWRGAPDAAGLALAPLGDQVGARPLSFAQERLWFLDRLTPGDPAYNVPLALRLEGRLYPAALAAALGAVVRRHASLRTAFGAVDGVPFQHAVPAPEPWPLPLADLAALPAAVARAESRRLAVEEGRRPFDLERGPLFRTALVRRDPGEHLVLATMHHIVSDGWSVRVLARDLAAFYEAAVAGRPAALPALPIQYADFAVWQRAWLSGGVLAAPARALAPAARRPAAGARAARRPAAAGGARLARRRGGAAAARGARARPRGPRPPPGREPVHDAARRVLRPARAGDRAERPRRRHADRRPHPLRGRGAHRLFRQHPGDARRARGRPQLRRAARPGARDGARRLRPPGPAVREARRGAEARAQPGDDAALPGRLPGAERAAGVRGAARAAVAARRRRPRHRQVRPHAGDARGGRAPGGGLLLQRRPLRPRHRAAPARAPVGAARRRRRGAGAAALGAAAAGGGRAPAGARGVERHGGRRRAGAVSPRPRGGAGGEDAGGPGAGRRRRAADLPRARRASRPPGGSPALSRRRPGGPGRGLRRAYGGDGGGAARHPQGRRRLRAARPGLSGRAAGVHAGGRRRQGAADPDLAPRPTAGARCARALPG